jgi:hypothetical protein
MADAEEQAMPGVKTITWRQFLVPTLATVADDAEATEVVGAERRVEVLIRSRNCRESSQ